MCWENDWPEAQKYADVIELKTAVGFGKRIWIQCTGPRYQGGLDAAPTRNKTNWTWTVAPRARPGDLILMYRSGTRRDAKRYKVKDTLLQSIANIYEVTSLPKPDNEWGRFANVRQLVILPEPLRLEHLKNDAYLKDTSWVRAKLRGRPDVTAHWWRIRQLILAMNPALRRNKRFLSACELSVKE